MTIDEAIQIENNIAEENQKIVDTQIVFDGVYISQLYCDDTEVIEEHLENYKKCVEYHEQIVEWLEELKAYKETKCNKSVYLANKSIDMIDAVNKGYADGYNKAIDDLLEDANEMAIEVDTGTYTMKAIGMVLLQQIAEQLKEGGKNEKERNAFDNAEQIVKEVAEEFATDTNVGTNGWISCSDRLPEEYIVLCCDKYGEMIVGHPYFDEVSNTNYSAESDNEMMYNCIAWQPLPEPYKESDE